MLMEEGVGVGGVGVGDVDATGPAIPPAQPAVQAVVARIVRTSSARECGYAFGERSRMQWRNAGEGPATVVKSRMEICVRNW